MMRWSILKKQSVKSGYVWCRCSCGTERLVREGHLRTGTSTSCGRCLQRSMIGSQFGKLVVQKLVSSGHSNVWQCQCDCGRIVERSTATLKKSGPKAGCNYPDCRFGLGSAARYALYLTYKRVAKKKKLPFVLTFEELIQLTSSDCYYCGSKPTTVKRTGANNGTYLYNGLDRVDNKSGYLKNNIVPCCKYCNAAKLDRSVAEFAIWAQQLVRNINPLWESKCWGRVWHRLYDDILGESLLEVKAGHRCSVHWHADRWNAFLAKDATIEIELFGPSTNDPKKASRVLIRPGESYIVPPQIWHRFIVRKSGTIVELYWTTNNTKCAFDDIHRWDVGK